MSCAAAVPVLEERAACSPLELVFARGTNENGLGSVGAPLSTSLASLVSGYFFPLSRGLLYSNSARPFSARRITTSISRPVSAFRVVRYITPIDGFMQRRSTLRRSSKAPQTPRATSRRRWLRARTSSSRWRATPKAPWSFTVRALTPFQTRSVPPHLRSPCST